MGDRAFQEVVKVKMCHISLALIQYEQGPYKKILDCEASIQDGGIGRYTLLPHTTKRRLAANLKTKKQPELPGN